MPASPSPENPLLSLSPVAPVPFHRIRAEHVHPAVTALLERAGENLRTLETAAPCTFDGTMLALDALTAPLDDAMAVVAHLESVATTPELRAAYNAVQAPVSAFFSSITLSDGLWKALKAFAATPEARALTGPRQRYLERTLDDFRRNGADLDPAGKTRLAALDVDLATTCVRYAQHVLDATNAFELVVDDPGQLSGLPEAALDAARESASLSKRAGYRFTLQAPSYVPAITYLDNRHLRERLYRAYNSRAVGGPTDNTPLLLRILQLRREKAKLLGRPHFADLVLEDRMAKSAQTALAFLDQLRTRVLPTFERENQELAAYRRELDGPSAPALEPWDLAYYAEKLRRDRFDFDEEALRNYFGADTVLAGLFELAKRLFGVSIEPWTDAPLWHPSVRAFVMRSDQGSEAARFYIDLFPRESKQDGAWMHGLLTGGPSEPHLGLVAANVTPPLAARDGVIRSAQLSRREVETLFHEFGHLLHHSLSRVELRSQSGTRVATDFVELPSKLLENWVWQREALDLCARDSATGLAVPDELLAKMKRARTFRAANAMMRQLGFSELDLALHTRFDPSKDGDVLPYARSIADRYSPTPLHADYAMVASFSHLFAHSVGYAAGYYSYQWAEVLEADAFSRFQNQGVLNPQVGQALRTAILEKGDSDDPMVLYKAFMGREPQLEALLARAGLSEQIG